MSRHGAVPAQVRGWIVLALSALAAMAFGLGQVLGVGPAFGAKALSAAGVVVLLAWPWLRARGAGLRVGPADRITLARAALVLVVAAFIGESPRAAGAALVLAGVAALLDAVDGWVARRTATASAFGARFDLETDALLILVLCVLAWQWDKAGAWVLLAGLARYAFVAAAHAAPWLRHPLPASRRRQAVCVLQIVALLICVAPPVPYPSSALVAAAGLVALAFSFTTDIAWLQRRARDAPPQEYVHDRA